MAFFRPFFANLLLPRVNPDVSHPVSVYIQTRSQAALGWKGPFKATQPRPPAVRRDIFSWIRLLRALSSLAWPVE